MAKKVLRVVTPEEAETSRRRAVEDKLAKLDAAIDQINKGLVHSPSARIHRGDQAPAIERIQTGILGLDIITGGGIPRCRFTQFKGEASVFKTSALLSLVAQVQAGGGTVAWLQGEEWDGAWAQRLGVDTASLRLIPGNVDGDGALERSIGLLESGALDLLVVDSIQGLAPTREIETRIGEAGYGSGAPQMFGQFCRRVLRSWSLGSRAAVVWTSQYRSVVGKFSPSGDNRDGTQIMALAHFKSIDVAFRKSEVHREGRDGPIYARTYTLRCEKNKTALPHRVASFKFFHAAHGDAPWGLDVAGEVAAWGVETGVIARAGAWYVLPGGKRCQGLEGLVAALRKSPDLDAIRAQVFAAAVGG